MADDAPWQPIIDSQHGLITRAQLRALGQTRAELRWALGRRWWLVLPRVVCTTGPALEPNQRLAAALLQAGPNSMIASTTAAAWHGITSAVIDGLVHVEAPMDAHPRSAGFVVVHRTRRPDHRPWHRGSLTITCRERAVVDAARAVGTAAGAQAIVCEAVERRLVRVEGLRHELEAGALRGSRLVRRALQAAEAGAWSVPEAELLRLMTGSSVLPAVWANPELVAADGTTLPTPDAWIDDVGLAVQVHSRRWHAESLDWERTVMGDGVFAEFGIPVVAVTPRAIRESPALVRQRIERAYRAALNLPRPAVSAVPTGRGFVA